jgi:hypothetical protein
MRVNLGRAALHETCRCLADASASSSVRFAVSAQQAGSEATCAQLHRHAPADLAESSNPHGHTCLRGNPMLLIIGALVTLIVAVIIPKVWASRTANDAEFGWVSEQWLAEYRASHPS